jgi:microcompartment protein CcmL/EutN
MILEALGMIEVTGYLGAVSAADAALKAANVQLLKSEKIKGGITTVELIGDVAAITAAVDAGRVVAEQLGCLRSSHVIPRLDPSVQELLLKKIAVKKEKEKSRVEGTEKKPESITEPEVKMTDEKNKPSAAKKNVKKEKK